jgi:hypothetical protein
VGCASVWASLYADCDASVGVDVDLKILGRFACRLAAFGAGVCLCLAVRWYVCHFRIGGVSLLTP